MPVLWIGGPHDGDRQWLYESPAELPVAFQHFWALTWRTLRSAISSSSSTSGRRPSMPENPRYVKAVKWCR